MRNFLDTTIDIVIEIGGHFIPIEVKIYAKEQKNQCYDYHQFAQKKSTAKTKLVYLTLSGTEPSPESTKTLVVSEDIHTISFSNDILSWLESCIALPETIKKTPIREILIQFASAIRKITNQLEDKPKMEMIELLSRSSENMLHARDIANSMEACRAEIIKKLFGAIEEDLKGNERLKLLDEDPPRDLAPNFDYRTEGCVEKFKYPGINYVVKSLAGGIDIILRIEISQCLFAGFGVAKNKNRVENNTIENSDSIRALFNNLGKEKPDSCWISWEYINLDDTDINFKDYNNNYFKLFDAKTFGEICNSAIAQVKEMLKRLK